MCKLLAENFAAVFNLGHCDFTQGKLMENREPEIDEAALKKLLEMGFEEQQAIQALRENK